MKRFFCITPLPVLIGNILLFNITVLAQINCKTIQQNDSTITTCFHNNGLPSSIEVWAQNKQWGRMQCFDAHGNEIANYQLRRIAGYSTVDLRYHPNGQVKRVEYSSAPDGGIQFYHTILEFDEVGKLTSSSDYSRPNGLPISPTVQSPMLHIEREQAFCAVPYLTLFRITNHTRRKVELCLTPQQTQWVALQPHCNMVLKSKSSQIIDSVLAEKFLPFNETYTIRIVKPKKTKRQPLIIVGMPTELNAQKEYIWHFIDQ